ncbi:hypothetical protein Tsubulata_038045 [Turnera subulata]|uniref:Uncharacterized protein n=1 Tax=Turnera subulata TaxID=218843 RepID=A0A9Q0GD34_9ROSI|nr:hypothetical protein Tsubulata_038045 [Turnera subulata]
MAPVGPPLNPPLVATREWLLLYPGSKEFSLLDDCLTESDDGGGQLLLVSWDSPHATFSFDFGRRVWVKQPGWKDRTVVFQPRGNQLNPFSVPAEGEASAFAGAMITHHRVYSNDTTEWLWMVDAYSNANTENPDLDPPS